MKLADMLISFATCAVSEVHLGYAGYWPSMMLCLFHSVHCI